MRNRRKQVYRYKGDIDETGLFAEEYQAIRDAWNNSDAKLLDVDYWNAAAKVDNQFDEILPEIKEATATITQQTTSLSELLLRFRYTDVEKLPEYAEAKRLSQEMANVIWAYWDVVTAIRGLRDVFSKYTSALEQATGA